jgi:hypothetical protein
MRLRTGGQEQKSRRARTRMQESRRGKKDNRRPRTGEQEQESRRARAKEGKRA